jgi:hypothetical protein
MFLASEPARLVLKVGLSFLAAFLSFWFIENPARLFLNSRKSMPLAYAFLLCSLALCVPVGIAVRNAYYIRCEPSDVIKGGIVFEPKLITGSVILMGDSHATMYGTVMKEICADLGYKLSVIAVDGGNPLPDTNFTSGQLWLDSLAIVKKERPDYLVFVCNWASKWTLVNATNRIYFAVETLKPLVGHLVIINQPPALPKYGSRALIRQGARPPFYEDAKIRSRRMEANDFLRRFNSGNCSVLDVTSHFPETNGAILFLDDRGRQLYYDDRGHLSEFGADLIRSDLKQSISLGETNRLK